LGCHWNANPRPAGGHLPKSIAAISLSLSNPTLTGHIHDATRSPAALIDGLDLLRSATHRQQSDWQRVRTLASYWEMRGPSLAALASMRPGAPAANAGVMDGYVVLGYVRQHARSPERLCSAKVLASYYTHAH